MSSMEPSGGSTPSSMATDQPRSKRERVKRGQLMPKRGQRLTQTPKEAGTSQGIGVDIEEACPKLVALYRQQVEAHTDSAKPGGAAAAASASDPDASQRTVVIWMNDLGVGMVVRPRGKVVQSLGWNIPPGRQMLHVEEVLYLKERGSLDVWDESGRRWSVQDAYDTLMDLHDRQLKDEAGRPLSVSLTCYIVYAHMKRAGYALQRRHPAALPTDSLPSPEEAMARLPAPHPSTNMSRRVFANFQRSAQSDRPTEPDKASGEAPDVLSSALSRLGDCDGGGGAMSAVKEVECDAGERVWRVFMPCDRRPSFDEAPDYVLHVAKWTEPLCEFFEDPEVLHDLHAASSPPAEPSDIPPAKKARTTAEDDTRQVPPAAAAADGGGGGECGEEAGSACGVGGEDGAGGAPRMGHLVAVVENASICFFKVELLEDNCRIGGDGAGRRGR
ncbi:unnamed protein product [Vitrella brassicaformis CCMP3155]|uniref:tRNA-splicing endonuclease subunit Sen54 N-terminal domain-containing protein n=2 Tax=Vitrella brassicaformis TaxID=1169539 RepID=A0A0G4E919_VITBC|nr:unnamed protein product [Vitrella brassicaformis CCMP3155]|eukprot:CEL91890.1 unnamed protein product [Vitrella brassicaformis CCMP3155]